LGETNFARAKIPLAWAKNLSLGRKYSREQDLFSP